MVASFARAWAKAIGRAVPVPRYPMASSSGSDSLLALVARALAGRYSIERELGRGGMGAVYLARDLKLQRPVAVKVLPPELAAEPALRERFLRETRLAASFSHPNIVHVHSVEDHPDVLAFVMGFVEGETLSERVARTGPLPADQVVRVMQETAWALGYAHARGVVHRDVKPDNIMVERVTGRALVMDFGIAQQQSNPGLTQAGLSVGTPQYMSPEQAVGETLDPRSDLYSLGCTMYHAAVGRPPFAAEAAHQLLAMHLTRAPEPLMKVVPGFPAELAELIERCMAKDPASRPANAEDLAEELEGMSARHREIAPMLRLFLQQATQRAQAMVVLLVLFFGAEQFISRQDSLGRMVIGTLLWTLLLGMFYKLVVRANHLVRIGFRHDDVRYAFDTTLGELAQARAQLLSDPHEVALLLRLRRLGIMSMAAGVGSWVVAFRFFAVVRNQLRAFSAPGVTLSVVGAVLFGIGIAMLAAKPSRLSLGQRLARRLWTGRVGRWVFARAERALAATRDA